MSLKYFAQKVGPAHYVLPRTASMRVDAHAFFSEALFERTEESMWKQLAAAAAYPGVIGAYLMPDAHSGYGVPVGCVVVTEDTILQAGSGYDVSCGVLYMRVPGLHAADVADWDRRARWIDEVVPQLGSVGGGNHFIEMQVDRDDGSVWIMIHCARAVIPWRT